MLKSFAILPVNTPTNDNLTHSESRVSDVSMCCRPFRSINTTVKVHLKQTCHCVNSIEICISKHTFVCAQVPIYLAWSHEFFTAYHVHLLQFFYDGNKQKKGGGKVETIHG